MVNRVYNSAAASFLSGDIDLVAGTPMVMLMTNTYSPNVDDDVLKIQITGGGNEVAASATYTGGGQELLSPAVTTDDTDDEGVFDALDNTWPSSTITASGAVIYMSGAGESTNYLVGYIDFANEQSSTAGDFTITWNAGGILNLSGGG